MKPVVKNQTPKSTAWLSKYEPKKIFDVILLKLLWTGFYAFRRKFLKCIYIKFPESFSENWDRNLETANLYIPKEKILVLLLSPGSSFSLKIKIVTPETAYLYILKKNWSILYLNWWSTLSCVNGWVFGGSAFELLPF